MLYHQSPLSFKGRQDFYSFPVTFDVVKLEEGLSITRATERMGQRHNLYTYPLSGVLTFSVTFICK